MTTFSYDHGQVFAAGDGFRSDYFIPGKRKIFPCAQGTNSPHPGLLSPWWAHSSAVHGGFHNMCQGLWESPFLFLLSLIPGNKTIARQVKKAHAIQGSQTSAASEVESHSGARCDPWMGAHSCLRRMTKKNPLGEGYIHWRLKVQILCVLLPSLHWSYLLQDWIHF